MELPRLREWRERRGYTQRGLAAEAGVSERSIASYEGGRNARPNTANKLARVLGITPEDLMDLEAFVEPRRSKPPKARAQPSKDEARAALPQGSALEALYKEAKELVSHAKELRESGNFFPEIPDAESKAQLFGVGRVVEFAWQADHCRMRALPALETAEKEESEQLRQALDKLTEAKAGLVSEINRALEQLELREDMERQAQELLRSNEAATVEDAKAE